MILQVQRGLDWCWGYEDSPEYPRPPRGGSDSICLGEVINVDVPEEQCSVLWSDNKQLFAHYRLGRGGRYDLALVHASRSPGALVAEPISDLKAHFADGVGVDKVVTYVSEGAIKVSGDHRDHQGNTHI